MIYLNTPPFFIEHLENVSCHYLIVGHQIPNPYGNLYEKERGADY
jgi:hypothetical protein